MTFDLQVSPRYESVGIILAENTKVGWFPFFSISEKKTEEGVATLFGLFLIQLAIRNLYAGSKLVQNNLLQAAILPTYALINAVPRLTLVVTFDRLTWEWIHSAAFLSGKDECLIQPITKPKFSLHNVVTVLTLPTISLCLFPLAHEPGDLPRFHGAFGGRCWIWRVRSWLKPVMRLKEIWWTPSRSGFWGGCGGGFRVESLWPFSYVKGRWTEWSFRTG